MKCPECVASGLRSTVTGGGGSFTCMGWTPYYDEDGAYHSHDPNYRTTDWRCSLGHRWNTSRLTPCSAPGCFFGHEAGEGK
jgi:hypothetical protein